MIGIGIVGRWIIRALIIIYKIIHNCYEQFLYFSKLDFFYNKQCENYLFNYFLFCRIIIIIFITLKSNFTKEKGMHDVWAYFMYNYTTCILYLLIFI